MESEGSFPRLQAATACPYPKGTLTPSPRPFEMFQDTLSLYGEELLALRPTLKLEDHPLSRVLDWLFSVGYSQLLAISGGNSSNRELRTRRDVVKGTDFHVLRILFHFMYSDLHLPLYGFAARLRVL